MKSLITLLGGCCLITLLSGCSSIMCGPKQNVSITSRPLGAEVLVYNSHAEVIYKGTTPCVAKLDRRSPDYVAGAKYAFVVKKEGYTPAMVPMVGTVNRAYFANILFGLVGLGIDPLTGSMWTLNPESPDPTVLSEHKAFFSEKSCYMVSLKEEGSEAIAAVPAETAAAVPAETK